MMVQMIGMDVIFVVGGYVGIASRSNFNSKTNDYFCNICKSLK